MFLLRWFLVAGALAAASVGCGPKPERQVCMGGSGGGNALVDGAAMMRLDVYSTNATCAGGLLADGAGAPMMSHTYVAGQAITLDVPPGPHTLVLTTFADQGGTMALGEACTQADLQAGSQICFDLSVLPAPVGADLSVISCTTSPDSCPAGQACDGANCVPGCKTSSDCAGNADAGPSTTPVCDPSSHQCVECLAPSDCPVNATCTGKKCVSVCAEGQKLCNGTCITTTACCSASECNAPPAPSACYGAVCTTPGVSTCQYNVKAGAQVCGSTCCLPINGACNADCTLACNNGFADCDGNRANGCETPTTTTSNCGGCGNVCDTTHSQGATCVGGTCQYASCSTGYANCNTTAPDINGCETHTDVDTMNCGACGRACSTANVASAHCSAGTCDSTCNNGFGNCSRPAAGATSPYTPDDGCESNLNVCTGQACCSMTTPTPAGMCAPPSTGANSHVNCDPTRAECQASPLMQTYAFCAAQGVPGDATTYSLAMAQAARASAPAGTDGAGMCGTAGCLNRTINGHCTSWCYGNDTSGGGNSFGNIAGHVFYNTKTNGCFCPFTSDPTWN